MHSHAEPDRRPVRILFVDDDRAILQAIGRVLRRDGFAPEYVSDPREALKLIEADRIEIVVSDEIMGIGSMSGVELLSSVHALFPDVLRVLVSGSPDQRIAIEAVNVCNVHLFIEKPWDVNQFRRSLHDLEARVLENRERAAPSPVRAIASFGKL